MQARTALLLLSLIVCLAYVRCEEDNDELPSGSETISLERMMTVMERKRKKKPKQKRARKECSKMKTPPRCVPDDPFFLPLCTVKKCIFTPEYGVEIEMDQLQYYPAYQQQKQYGSIYGNLFKKLGMSGNMGLFGGFGGMGGYGSMGSYGGLPGYFGYGGYIKKRKILDTGLDYYTPTFEAQICEGRNRICDCDCDCKCKRRGVKTCQQKYTPQYKYYYVYDTYYYQPKEEYEEEKKKDDDDNDSKGFDFKKYYLYYLYQKIISQMFSSYQTPSHDPFYQSPNYNYQNPSGTNQNYNSNPPPQTPPKPYGNHYPHSPYPATPGHGHHYPTTPHNPDHGTSGVYSIHERGFFPGENGDSSMHSQYDPYSQYPSMYNMPSMGQYPFYPYQNGGGQQQTPWWYSLYFGGNQHNSYFDNYDVSGINYLYSQSPQVKKVFLKVMIPDGCECKRLKKSKKEEDESFFPRSGCQG